MRKAFLSLLTFLMCLTVIFALASCGNDVEFKVNFVVDGEIYSTINTSGDEIIKMPENPTKEGYAFDGWYWDKDEWQKPFTANSLLDAPLSSDMNVYAKWEHIHISSDWIVDKDATCKEAGAKHKECTDCEEVLETASIDKLTTHTPGGAVVENFVDSTCKTAGSYNSVVYCSVCEEKLSSEAKTIEKKPHTEVIDQAVEPTCTETGLTEGKHCSECDTVIVEQAVVKMLDHEYSDELSYNATHHFYECECGHKKDETRHTSSGAATATTDEVCTVCGYIIAKAVGISFKTLTVDGNNVCGKVSNDTTYYSFINEIVATGGAKYVVSTNISGTNVLPNKTIDLNIGDNTVYITEYINDEPTAVYTVVIRRRAICEVQFSANGGTSVLTQYVEEDSFATEPQTSRAGYTFAGWNYDFANPITKNTVISASWNPNKNTKYEVWYYLQNIDGSYSSTPNVVDKLAGTTDTEATAEQKNFPHFTFNEVKSITSGNIDGDGSLVLAVYYTRDTYTISTSVSDAKGGSVTAGGTYPYGSEITLSVIVNAGYTFGGYKIGDNIVWNTENYSFAVSEDAVFVVDVTANTNTKYTVEYYLANIESGYTMVESVELYGTTDTTAIAEQKLFEHFTIWTGSSSTLSGNIAGDGSLVLKLYYTRNSYEIYTTTNNNKGGDYEQICATYYYGVKLPLTARTNPGYTFLGWFDGDTLVCETTDFDVTVEKNATYTAKWQANEDTPYKVEYYLQNIDGTYPQVPTSVLDLEGITDTEAIAEQKIFEHFTFDSNKSIMRGNIDGNGSLVLEVYYTRDNYIVTTSVNNSLAGAVTSGDTYKFDTEITLTATTNPGYTFLGWYDGDTRVCETLFCTFNVDHNATYEARWKANENTKYEVWHYLENIDGSYSEEPNIVDRLEGTTDTEITVRENSYTHFTFDEDSSVMNGNIYGDGTLVLKLYYTRNIYTLLNANEDHGVVTYTGNYKYGAEKEVMASANIGCDFIGWFNNDALISDSDTYSFTAEMDIEARFAIKEEMAFFNFTSDQMSCTITGLKDRTQSEIIIPDYVTSVEQSAFSGCSIQSATLPASLIGGIPKENLKTVVITSGDSISANAFSNCASLTSISISDSVTSIGSSAFKSCTGLTSIVIPGSITSIDDYAFSGCTGLVKVYVNDIVKWCGISFDGYNANPLYYAENLYLNGELVTNLVIPDSVTSIGSYVFYGCTSLTSVTIGNSVTSIDSSAFGDCYKLVEVINHSSLNITKGSSSNGYIGRYAEEVHNGESKIDNVGDYLFYTYDGVNYLLAYIGNDTELVLPDNYNGDAYKIYRYAFSNYRSITSISIPDSVTSIGSSAFSGRGSLEAVYITDIAAWCEISFGDYVANPLYNAENLYLNGKLVTNLVIPDSVTSIGSYAFYGCDSLISITIPDSVTSIGTQAFDDCTRLTSVTIKNGITRIGSYAFSDCTNLTSVTIGSGVTSIGNSAFSNCTSLTSVTIGSGVTSIGNFAFSNCTSLKSIIIPDNVTSIGSSAFAYCYGLTSVTIGNGIKSIGAYAFRDCTSLTSVTIKNGITSIGSYAFAYCYGLTSVTIPGSVTSIGDNAFAWCSNLTYVTVGNGVKSIGSAAFYDCTSLESIIYYGTQEQWDLISKGYHWNHYFSNGHTYTIKYTMIYY